MSVNVGSERHGAGQSDEEPAVFSGLVLENFSGETALVKAV